LTEELMTAYDEIRLFFVGNPDERCVPLFLNSFGNGSGFGVYQLVDNLIAMFPSPVVMPHLVAALRSPFTGVRYWNAQIAALFPDPVLVPILCEMLRNDDIDAKSAAVTALGQIPGDDAEVCLREALLASDDEMLRELIRDAISTRES
jgi:hypothetical protein